VTEKKSHISIDVKLNCLLRASYIYFTEKNREVAELFCLLEPKLGSARMTIFWLLKIRTLGPANRSSNDTQSLLKDALLISKHI